MVSNVKAVIEYIGFRWLGEGNTLGMKVLSARRPAPDLIAQKYLARGVTRLKTVRRGFDVAGVGAAFSLGVKVKSISLLLRKIEL